MPILWVIHTILCVSYNIHSFIQQMFIVYIVCSRCRDYYLERESRHTITESYVKALLGSTEAHLLRRVKEAFLKGNYF